MSHEVSSVGYRDIVRMLVLEPDTGCLVELHFTLRIYHLLLVEKVVPKLAGCLYEMVDIPHDKMGVRVGEGTVRVSSVLKNAGKMVSPQNLDGE